MSEQRFREWNPIEGIPPRLYLEAAHDDYEGLRFLLNWLVYEAGGVLKAESLVHYAIYTLEDCIDVVRDRFDRENLLSCLSRIGWALRDDAFWRSESAGFYVCVQ